MPQEDAVRHQAEEGRGPRSEQCSHDPAGEVPEHRGGDHQQGDQTHQRVLGEVLELGELEGRAERGDVRQPDPPDEQGEQGGGGDPCEQRLPAAQKARSRVAPRLVERNARHGEAHADGEPVERAGQDPGGQIERRSSPQRPGTERDRAEVEQRQQHKLASDPGPDRRASGHARHQHREHGEHEIEGHLRGERPGGADSLEVGLGGVDLQKAVVDPPVPGEHAGEAGPDRQQRECRPVGRHDPEQAPADVSAGAHRRPEPPAGGEEGAVEQEARDHEEDRHAHVQPRQQRADPVAEVRPGGV